MHIYSFFWRKLIIKPSLPFHTIPGVLKEGIMKWLAIPFFFLLPKKGVAKECSKYHTIALISHTSKVILKILQTRLQQFMNHELPDVQTGFRKGRGTRGQIVNIFWIIKKAREFHKKHPLLLYRLKNLFLIYWLHQSFWLCWSQQTVENS